MSTPLTHDAMVRVKDGTGDWQCVRCRRRGSIAHINAAPCPNPSTAREQVKNLFDAIEGKLDVVGISAEALTSGRDKDEN